MGKRAGCLLALLVTLVLTGGLADAKALPYHVVAEAQVSESQSRLAGLHASVAHPRALAVRLWARRNGRNLRGQVSVRVVCGRWHRLSVLRGLTPFVKQVPFLRGSGLCVVDASAMEVNQNSHAYLHLVLLAR